MSLSFECGTLPEVLGSMFFLSALVGIVTALWMLYGMAFGQLSFETYSPRAGVSLLAGFISVMATMTVAAIDSE